MGKKIIANAAILLLWMVSICWSQGGVESPTGCQAKQTKADPVETILSQLKKRATTLRSYEGHIEYLFRQPLLESETLQKGVLYYQRCGKKSKLRVNFQTLKHEDEKEQKYIDHYIFDGVWLTRIDYQIQAVQSRQLAEPNEPVDAFDLASRGLPIIGFTKIENLNKQFQIELAEPKKDKAQTLVQLRLKVRPDSIYKNDYKSVDFWIDKKLHVPAKVVAVTTEDDIYEIKLLKPKVNKGIDKKVFAVQIPEGFSRHIIPLEKKKQK
jgi:outer membrane lipoprotein-sorting protein